LVSSVIYTSIVIVLFGGISQHYFQLHPAARTRLGVILWSITHRHDKGIQKFISTYTYANILS